MHTRLICGDGLRDELRSYSIATGVASRYSSTFTLKISWSRVFSYQILFSSPKMTQIFASEFSKTSRLNVSWMSRIFADQRFIGVSLEIFALRSVSCLHDEHTGRGIGNSLDGSLFEGEVGCRNCLHPQSLHSQG